MRSAHQLTEILKERETRLAALRQALKEGEESGRAEFPVRFSCRP
ncbi:MAG: hypothetical protein FJ190_07115 [Gammaproteobacteria bacterium]|nr:hypothetical protein [Gammaproteobacteria bacterium]